MIRYYGTGGRCSNERMETSSSDGNSCEFYEGRLTADFLMWDVCSGEVRSLAKLVCNLE